MKTRNKALLLSLCAVLLVVASVMGTMAFLTDKESVTNTFTVGKVDIDVDETPVDPDGNPDPSASPNTDGGYTYNTVPGHTYTKDPTITVKANSEDSYVFAKVENGIAAFETKTGKTIAQQITKNGWTKLDGVDNVYYKEYSKTDADTKYTVFSEFTLDENADSVDGWDTIDQKSISITGYAIQKDGFDDVASAWAAVNAD